MAAFPPEWRDYFSTGDEPSFEGWEAALAAYEGKYCVLYGPPAATKAVRSHIAGLPGLKMLGRLFDPDANARSSMSPQAARDGHGRIEDRPVALANAFAEANGVPIIEVCPGDERHGEEFFVADPRALILSCEPGDPEIEDDAALFWALVATSSKSASRELRRLDADSVDHDLGPRGQMVLQAFIDSRVLASPPRVVRRNGAVSGT